MEWVEGLAEPLGSTTLVLLFHSVELSSFPAPFSSSFFLPPLLPTLNVNSQNVLLRCSIRQGRRSHRVRPSPLPSRSLPAYTALLCSSLPEDGPVKPSQDDKLTVSTLP